MQYGDSSARYRLVESLYQRALDVPPDSRGAFLLATCGGDAQLRQEVEALVDHYRMAGSSFLERPVHAIRETIDEPGAVPSRIGMFRIVRLLGRGGMSAVFEAEQDSPKRRVAIKIIRTDLYSAESQRRFRREANLLAQLRHPRIAQIYEFGSANAWYGSDERPRQLYFAMELVNGEPLTQFAATRDLGLNDRLRLIIQLCDAVQHAHQKGVIHRDLKPGNILVSSGGVEIDTEPSLKVLDFGVAKVLETNDGEQTRTSAGGLVGTIAYMSPEQSSERSEQVDTRSDVYSIGVVAYELLAGRLPIDVAGLSVLAAIRRLGEADVPRAGSIRRELRGDIEVILARALEREPARRYASAAELGADIRRCLHHEPVTARGQSVVYLLSRFARRNRSVVAGIAVALLAVAVGSGVAVASAWRATQEAQRATKEASRAGHVRDFLRDMLASAGPRSMHSPDVTVRQILDEAAAAIEGSPIEAEPEVEAVLRTTIGETYLGLGRYEAALTQLEKARAIVSGSGDSTQPDAIAVQNLIARVYCGLTRYDDAEQLHLDSIRSARISGRADSPIVAGMLCDLGDCLHQAGKLEAALAAHSEALSILERSEAPASVDVARVTMEVGRVLHDMGKLADAEPLLRRALRLRRENLPPGHPDIAYSLNRLGWLLYRRYGTESVESEEMLRESLAIYRKVLDPANPELATCLNNLGMRIKIGRNPEAVALLREALEIREAALGPGSPYVAESLMHLAHALSDFDQPEEVIRLCDRALEIRRAVFGEMHQEYAFSLHDVAAFHLSRGDPETAIPLFRESLAILVERLGEGHDLVAHVQDSLGVALLAGGADAEALELLELALAQRRRVLGPSHEKVAISLGNVALARLQTGDAEGALDAANSCIGLLKSDAGEKGRYARALLVRGEATLVLDATKADRLAGEINEALEILRAVRGEESWQAADAMRVKAIGLLCRGELDKAKAELESAASILDCVDRPCSPQVNQVRQRIALVTKQLGTK